MSQDKEREKKQQFLCKEIIDKNYDANEFENYCKEVIMNSSLGVEGAVDIDKWDFLELKLIVKNFQKISKTIEQQKEQVEIQQQTSSATYEENYTYYSQQNQDQQYQQFEEEQHQEYDSSNHHDQIQQEKQEICLDQQQQQQKGQGYHQIKEEVLSINNNNNDDNNEKQSIEIKQKDKKNVEQHEQFNEEEQKQIQALLQSVQFDEMTIKQQQEEQNHNEDEEDLFEKLGQFQGQQLIHNENNIITRERSETDQAFENFQKNLVVMPNNDFSSNIWQMPDFSNNSNRNSFQNNNFNNNFDQNQQDPFQFTGFDSFSNNNQDDKIEQIRKKTGSKQSEGGNTSQQQNQIQNDQQFKKNNTPDKQPLEQDSDNKKRSTVNSQSDNDTREKKSSSCASDASKDSSQLQELEFQKQMDEFKANDFKTLKQLNVYNGGLQPEVIESNSVVKIQCKKLGQSLLSTKQQVNIYISNTKTIQSGLFGSLTTYYVIQTKPFGWEVQRKLEDFIWLQNILVKMYPGIVIPKMIQPKKIKTEKQEKNRRSFLEHFLNMLILNKDIKNSKFILDFLYVTDEKVFKDKIKESDKFPKPKNLAYILNHDGFVRLDYSKLENKAADEALNQYLDVSEGYYKKLKKLSKELMNQFQVVSNTLFELGQIFTNLHQNAMHFKQALPTHNIQFNAISETYKIMNNINMMQGNNIKDQIKTIENHYYHFFKFQQENNQSIKSLSKLKTTMQDEYVKRINNKNVLSSLKKSISSSFANETIDQPSKDQEVLKDQIAYYTYQLDKQISTFFNDKSRSYANEFGMYSNLSQCFQSEMKIFWQDVLKSFEQVKQVSVGKKIAPLKIDMMKKVA